MLTQEIGNSFGLQAAYCSLYLYGTQKADGFIFVLMILFSFLVLFLKNYSCNIISRFCLSTMVLLPAYDVCNFYNGTVTVVFRRMKISFENSFWE